MVNGMETRSAKKMKARVTDRNADDENGIDRVSDLPDYVLHHILMLLPIKTIAKTSVLSKRWRSIWSSFPDLDFTTINPLAMPYKKNIKQKRSSSSSPHSNKLVPTEFISEVLALRDKQSHLRILRFRAPLTFSRLNGLIRNAIKLNVQQLDVEVATDDYFNFPRCVITSESLRVFKLKSRYPGFRLPPSSVMNDGFRYLNTLSLSLVILYNQPSLDDLFTDFSFPLLKKLNLDACFGLKQLVVGCRVLEDLTLENCFQLSNLEISGMKLERLRVASCFDAYCEKSLVRIYGPSLKSFQWEFNAITGNCCVEHLTSLQEASIGLFVLDEDISKPKLQSVSNLLSGISSAHCLTLESQCVEILSNKSYFRHFLHPFKKLKLLKLHTGFNRHNVPGLACLFSSSPNIDTLVITIINDYKIERKKWNKDIWDMSTSEVELFWESQVQSLKPFLNNLNVVRIHGFLDCENEVSLVKFLLKHGKALQEMTLCTGHCNSRDSLRRQKIRSQMMGFSWASSNAKISFH